MHSFDTPSEGAELASPYTKWWRFRGPQARKNATI
jgi:hypothetical protein